MSLSQVLGHAHLLSPLVTVPATLYAPLSALLHGYRNTKVRRELGGMLGLGTASEDVVTPLPSRKIFRSLSMRESTRVGRLRRERLGHRHSFMGELRRPGVITAQTQPSDCQESHTLLLALASSAESSARSSFSGAGSHPRYVTVLAGRQEATC